MISHAQNAEDVVLARALPAATGFYVDVGAADPSIASVTKHFYDLGWHGINIEPRQDAADRLAEQRPRDWTIRAAAGSRDGMATLFEVADDLDVSTASSDQQARLLDEGRAGRSVEVPMRTLDSILDEADPPALDFLKIDVEGSEADVLAGLDLHRWRPTILVVEAVRAWTNDRNDGAWRDRVLSAGYTEALFDGLNAFFVANEHTDAIGPLPPASVLDRFTFAREALLDEEIGRLREHAAAVERELANYRVYQTGLEVRLADATRQDDEVTAYVRHLESELQSLRDAQPQPIPVPPVELPPLPAQDISRILVTSADATERASLAAELAAALDARVLPADHPADVDWANLPRRSVVALDWAPTSTLRGLLDQHRVQAVAGEEPGAPAGPWSRRPSTLTIDWPLAPADRSAAVTALVAQLTPPVHRLRVAIVGTPRTGSTWIRRVLADAFDLAELPVDDPADLRARRIPERVAVQVHWPPTPEFVDWLQAEQFAVISPGRHPLDVLLSVLHLANRDRGTASWLLGRGGDESALLGAEPGDAAFVQYGHSARARALLDVTPAWWARPGTIAVTYEQLMADPTVEFDQLAVQLGQEPSAALQHAVAANTPERLGYLSSGVHVWRAVPGMHLEVLDGDVSADLTAAHHDVLTALGYAS